VAYTTHEEYDAIIQQVILFLEGKHDEVLKRLQEKMEQAAEELHFEEAARIRDRIQAVERVLEKQRIINTEGQDDQDVIALARGDDETCAQIFFFRAGKLVGREYFILQGTLDSSNEEIMASFIQQFYDTSPHVPQSWLQNSSQTSVRSSRVGCARNAKGQFAASSAVSISIPKRGEKLHLVEMVKQNAQQVLEQQRIKWLTDSQKTQLALEELQETLNLITPPKRIDATISQTPRGPTR